MPQSFREFEALVVLGVGVLGFWVQEVWWLWVVYGLARFGFWVLSSECWVVSGGWPAFWISAFCGPSKHPVGGFEKY